MRALPAAVEGKGPSILEKYSRPNRSKLKRRGRIRLVFLIRNIGIGGAERQLCALAKSLDSSRFNVTVVCFYGGGELTRDLIDAGVPVISLGKKGRWEVLGFLFRLVRELRKLKPDILHPYLTEQNVLAMLVKPMLPRTRVVWGVRASNMNAGPHEWLASLLLRLEVRLSRFVNLIIFNSFAGEACALSAGFGRVPRMVIPNGIDLSYFLPDPATRATTRASLRIADHVVVVGIVGRLDPMKDHPTFLKAAAEFARHYPEARFVCVGNGPDEYARRLTQLAEALGLGDKLTRLPAWADMPAMYNAFDICCSSSAYGEGTPNCVAEAMACGVPCVVTNVGDSSLLVGEAGIVVPPGEPDALAAGLAAMAARIKGSSEPSRLSRRRAEERFNIRAMVNETSEALLSLF